MKIETELGGVEVPAYNPNTRGQLQKDQKFKVILSYLQNSRSSLHYMRACQNFQKMYQQCGCLKRASYFTNSTLYVPSMMKRKNTLPQAVLIGASEAITQSRGWLLDYCRVVLPLTLSHWASPSHIYSLRNNPVSLKFWHRPSLQKEQCLNCNSIQRQVREIFKDIVSAVSHRK